MDFLFPLFPRRPLILFRQQLAAFADQNSGGSFRRGNASIDFTEHDRQALRVTAQISALILTESGFELLNIKIYSEMYYCS